VCSARETSSLPVPVSPSNPLEDREHLAHRQAGADQLAEALRLTRGDLEGLGLGLDPHRGAAELERGAGDDVGRREPRALVPGAVGRAEVAHREAGVGGADLEVTPRHPIVGQDQRHAGLGADDARRRAQPTGPAAVRSLDHDELTARRPQVAGQGLAVHGRDAGPGHATA
jgi:hypothetical protein